MPEDAAFARFLEIMRNDSDVDVDVEVRLETWYRNGSPSVIATSSGDLLVTADDDFHVLDLNNEADPGALAIVYHGPDAPVGISTMVFGTSSGRNTQITYNVTVPAHDYVAIMQFGIKRTIAADAVAMAASLRDMQGRALFGMDQALRDRVLNFVAVPDTDGDGVTDVDEAALGTDPADPDTDDDGLIDGFEVEFGFDPLLPGDELLDPDADGLTSLEEQATGTDPTDPDGDSDGLDDGAEIAAGTDPFDSDTDEDELGDGAEIDLGTDPLVKDTDGGGTWDGREVDIDGTDPLDPADDIVPPGLSFSGIRVNVPLTEVTDGEFVPCFTFQYNQTLSIQTARNNCTGDVLLMGCRQTNANALQVAAMGLHDEVFFDSGTGNGDFHAHNGVGFYFSESRSWGFFPLGGALNRNSCDTASDSAAQRMCWHTSNGNVSSGWRCGANTSVSSGWERTIYQRDGTIVPRD